jgi:hypothetical protein
MRTRPEGESRQARGSSDKPIAGLLRDLKSAACSTTIVVFARNLTNAGAQGGDGRDHHIYGFSAWMAGAAFAGTINGATDEIGFHAVQGPPLCHDIHATLLQQLGLTRAA